MKRKDFIASGALEPNRIWVCSGCDEYFEFEPVSTSLSELGMVCPACEASMIMCIYPNCDDKCGEWYCHHMLEGSND